VDYRRGVTEERYAHVEPLDVDAVRTVQVGTLLWAVALVGCVIFRQQLEDAGRGWWTWACVAGVVLGGIGVIITTQRRRRLARNSGQSK
jgi:hypothetical protein